jgi:hypothetical protein
MKRLAPVRLENSRYCSFIPTLTAMTYQKAAPDLQKIDQIITEFCSNIGRFNDDEINSVMQALFERIPMDKLSNAELEYLSERLEYIVEQAE